MYEHPLDLTSSSSNAALHAAHGLLPAPTNRRRATTPSAGSGGGGNDEEEEEDAALQAPGVEEERFPVRPLPTVMFCNPNAGLWECSNASPKSCDWVDFYSAMGCQVLAPLPPQPFLPFLPRRWLLSWLPHVIICVPR